MPDRKFEQRDDRQKITLDFKQRIIDLMANQQPLPDVGIYDEPVRYFKANEQWCAVIFGWLDWLEDVAGWPESENENHAGIQAILIFEEGIQMEPIDYGLLKQAISEGMYEFGNNIAKQIVSGRTTNISVGEDGTVTNPTDEVTDDSLPEDDPSTDYDESLMAKSGGASGVRLGLNGLFGKMNAFYSLSLPVATAKTRLKLLYTLNEAEADAFVDFYYTSYAVASNAIVFGNGLDGYLFCKGISTQSIARYIYDLAHAPATDIPTIEMLLPALTDEQMTAWYNAGLESPSTDYLAYSCTPIPDYAFNLTAFGTLFNDSHVLKKFHRYLVTVQGYFLDPDGDIQDAFWHKQVGQNEVYDATPDLNIQISNATKRYPTVFEVPYDAANHRYTWSIEMGENDASPNWTINRDTGTMAAGSTSPTGGLAFTVHDLGEIVN